MNNLDILIIDDHPLFRTGLSMILEGREGFGIIRESDSVMAALAHEKQSVDLILLDLQMPGLNGLKGIKVLQNNFINTPIIILSASKDSSDISEAKRLGAVGFLRKSAGAEEITSAISTALTGGECFPDSKGSAPSKNESINLTARQLEVLVYLCEGKSNKVIGRHLDMAENTVRGHVSKILASLSVTGRSQAIIAAQQLGLIELKRCD